MHQLDFQRKDQFNAENITQCPVFSSFWGGGPFVFQLNTGQ